MARPVDDVDIGDFVALTAHQRRQKTMQPVKIRHHQEHLAPERLQAAAGVARAVLQDRAAHAIGDARLDFLKPGILAPYPLAGGKACAVAAALDRHNQIRQEDWIILPVPVERRPDPPPPPPHPPPPPPPLTLANPVAG